MSDPITVQEMLNTIHDARAEWDALLAKVPRERMTEPGVMGDWSIKDIVAHVTWSEREMVPVLRERRFRGSDLWNLPVDERNQIVYEENRSRPLDEVLAESRDVFTALREALAALSDAELNEAGRIAEMPPGWTLAVVLPGNTFQHYLEHAAPIRTWLARE